MCYTSPELINIFLCAIKAQSLNPILGLHLYFRSSHHLYFTEFGNFCNGFSTSLNAKLPGCLIEHLTIEQNQTPIIRLCLVIKHNQMHKKFCQLNLQLLNGWQSNTIKGSIIEQSAIKLNPTIMGCSITKL